MKIPEQMERIRQAADQLYTEAEHLNELTGIRIRELAGPGVGWHAYRHVFPGNQFLLLRRAWLLKHISSQVDGDRGPRTPVARG